MYGSIMQEIKGQKAVQKNYNRIICFIDHQLVSFLKLHANYPPTQLILKNEKKTLICCRPLDKYSSKRNRKKLF